MPDDRRRGTRMRDEDRAGPASFGSRGGYGRGLDDDAYASERGGRERDFGDSAGYGSGGSARDWREVMGDRRRRYDDPESFFRHASQDEHDDRGLLERAGDGIRSLFRDERSGPGRFRGRGPKGYRRSDERIREDVGEHLTEDPHVDASEIEVAVEGGEVTLSGTVNTRFEKRHAEDVAHSVSGVTHVQNNLRVQPPGMSAGENAPTGAVADSMGFGTTRTGMASATPSGQDSQPRPRR